MNGDDAGTCRQNHFRIVQSLFGRVEDANLGGDWDVEIEVEVVDESEDKVLILLQERAVVAFASDTLWTAEVQIDGIAEGLDMASGGEQVVGVIGAKLDEQRTIGLVVAIEMVVLWVELSLVEGDGGFGHGRL